MSSEREAQALLAKADKKATTFGWFGSNKFEEAAELYNKAANIFKLGKRWKEAGDAFTKAANMQLQLNERDDAATTFINAAKCYKKGSFEATIYLKYQTLIIIFDPTDAITSLKQAIEILTDRGRFQAAAGHQKDIAQIYESDLIDLEKAMQAYEIAADWYAGEEATALANNCLLKVATFAATLEQYDKAIEKFEQVAAASLDNQLTKWSLKDYFLKAGLCHIAFGDHIGAKRAIERYCDMDVTFSTTRECQFLKAILEAVENDDIESFTNRVVEFDQLTKLDNWKTTILLRIKKSIQEGGSLTDNFQHLNESDSVTSIPAGGLILRSINSLERRFEKSVEDMPDKLSTSVRYTELSLKKYDWEYQHPFM
ncbi:10377_t:CDS:2 [Racocetra fulgida]|uniref:10377_t:CDS:1 n=1 Tax=Racocetra fulgida TaxID=60492 RepID=A0A9N8W7V9_9GLOM|nr:10377_t:CDS:2 [Racocetra fulgida]